MKIFIIATLLVLSVFLLSSCCSEEDIQLGQYQDMSFEDFLDADWDMLLNSVCLPVALVLVAVVFIRQLSRRKK